MAKKAKQKTVETANGVTARDWVWYEQWAVHFKSFREIAAASRTNHMAVYRAIQEVSAVIREECHDSIMQYRIRHTTALNRLAQRNLKLFEDTNDAKYSAEARSALADVREIWGANKPQKLEISGGEGHGLERVAGMSRAEAIRRRAETLLARANAIEAKTPVAAEGEPENV